VNPAFLIQMVLIFAIFYFLLIRPQAKERKKQEDMLKALKKGDEIITSGGIIGKIVHVDENRLTVKTGENTRLTVDRGRVATVVGAAVKAQDTSRDKTAE
jgi:preprotein translocase subunit YajC